MRKLMAVLILMMLLSGVVWAEKEPLNVAIVWHQHQPIYWNRLTGEYELPWVRVHGVQEYIDSPMVLEEFPGIHVTFNLQPSLLWQLLDYVEISPEERSQGGIYGYIGAVDNHLKWVWKLIHEPGAITPEERARMQEQFFWINGYLGMTTATSTPSRVRARGRARATSASPPTFANVETSAETKRTRIPLTSSIFSHPMRPHSGGVRHPAKISRRCRVECFVDRSSAVSKLPTLRRA